MGGIFMAKKDNSPKISRASKVKRRLLNATYKTGDTLLIQYDNSYQGYDEETVEEMRDEYGVNIITNQKKTSLLMKIYHAFINPFSIVLLLLIGVSFITHDIAATIIVSTMVLISGLISFIQEYKSSTAAEKLEEMVETTVAIVRTYEDEETEKVYSKRKEIPLDEVVVGDVIHLAAGDIIPADVRIIKAKDLFISQSSLTGESEPIEKFSHEMPSNSKNPLDYNNLAFMGSTVVSGSAVAIVLAVGDDTMMGSIAETLRTKTPPTSFEKGVKSVSMLLIRFMAFMVPVVFLITGFTKGSWLNALLFAASVAVGLTPEMLPMIVATNLAKGATSMAKKKVIIKELNSIQNFGAMDVLCTDKTGTLTQDKIILEYHLDVHGNSDNRVLRHAFLNSYYQTGLKNLMDLSIIERCREEKAIDDESSYTKVDEIPFDFARRRMSVVVKDKNGKTQLITKGAIEEMISISKFVEYKGQVLPLDDELKKEILEICQKFNADGLRVLGVSQKTNPRDEGAFSVADESEMVLIGYLAFLDPPKESASEAISALYDYGVDVKVLTGDNDAVTISVCKQVGIETDKILLGSDVEKMSDVELKEAVEEVNVFAKLSPDQKARIVETLRSNGHTVGYLGDGINDAPAMKMADVGVSVDTAVDIAKESANIILLEKDLMALEQGVIEGRKTYANIIKYIKITVSSNFGNMFSVLVASAFLPFLPMLPIQLLMLSLIYNISCIAMPWDNVDSIYLKKPRTWNAGSISKFMISFGPISSIFDITTYALLFFIICPNVIGDGHTFWTSSQPALYIALFQAGWFVESMWSQTFIIHLLRTPRLPFIHSRASFPVLFLTTLGIATLTAIPFTPFGKTCGFAPLPPYYFAWLVGTIILYVVLVSIMKKIFVRVHKELL